MKSVILIGALLAPVGAAAQGGLGSPDTFYRYEFDVRVVSNGATSPDLSTLSVGTMGTYTVDVSPDTTVFPSDDPGFIQIYQILDVGLDIGAVQSGASAGAYPSSIFTEGFFVQNDAFATPGFVKDGLSMITKFSHPEMGFSLMLLEQTVPNGVTPTMLSSVDLPMAFDTSLNNTAPSNMLIEAIDGSGDLRLDIDGVQVTVIPTPSALGVLGLGGLAMVRRRR